MASGFGFRRWTANEENSWRWSYPQALEFYWLDEEGNEHSTLHTSIDDWLGWAHQGGAYDQSANGTWLYLFPDGWEEGQVGWKLASCATEEGPDGVAYNAKWWFWRIKAIAWLGLEGDIARIENRIDNGATVHLSRGGENLYNPATNTLIWNPRLNDMHPGWQALGNQCQPRVTVDDQGWMEFNPLSGLAHELRHLYDDTSSRGLPLDPTYNQWRILENRAMGWENIIRRKLRTVSPVWVDQYPDEVVPSVVEG